MPVTGPDGQLSPFGFDQSRSLWQFLRDQKYLDATGKVQDTLRRAIKEDTLRIPERFAPQRGQITDILRKLAGRLDIKDADEKVPVPPRQRVLHGAEFKALWDRIKHQTTYRLHFDNEQLIEDCIKAVQGTPSIARARLQWRTADLAIGKAGVLATERSTAAPVTLEESAIELPDLLTKLQDDTQLTRRSIYRILVGSGRLDDFKRNPQQFIELVAQQINRCKRLAIVDGIKYQRLGDDYYYAQELFEQKELKGYLTSMLKDTQKSIYEDVIYQSETERAFAEQLEKNEAIKVYAKLPDWFTINTPLGTYNPDWAILVHTDEGERLYLVVETKSTLFAEDMRGAEDAKIRCGKAHFAALADGDNPARFIGPARTVDDVLTAAQEATHA